ncbi:hypothetical protein BDA96_01G242900 [Sorghum bicolor]|uniref:Uncharacterized protein n=2 Tax=Sorghum bicolor TaxID=4558 RepID=A0A921V157_SORBI|nr:hypothetical protein BDA96_01G242900 [Sorghum bicolor]KXG38404.1 hypothetical protein SORBI_3001G228500 [Sorghum bicolor]
MHVLCAPSYEIWGFSPQTSSTVSLIPNPANLSTKVVEGIEGFVSPSLRSNSSNRSRRTTKKQPTCVARAKAQANRREI